jgi:hypothetical protein
MIQLFKKMAGTSAVFVSADYQGASPVERDGLSWSSEELHFDQAMLVINAMPAMANVLALEGLEEYEPPRHGDVRYVQSLDVEFVYWQPIRGWIQYRQ